MVEAARTADTTQGRTCRLPAGPGLQISWVNPMLAASAKTFLDSGTLPFAPVHAGPAHRQSRAEAHRRANAPFTWWRRPSTSRPPSRRTCTQACGFLPWLRQACRTTLPSFSPAPSGAPTRHLPTHPRATWGAKKPTQSSLFSLSSARPCPTCSGCRRPSPERVVQLARLSHFKTPLSQAQAWATAPIGPLPVCAVLRAQHFSCFRSFLAPGWRLWPRPLLPAVSSPSSPHAGSGMPPAVGACCRSDSAGALPCCGSPSPQPGAHAP